MSLTRLEKFGIVFFFLAMWMAATIYERHLPGCDVSEQLFKDDES